MLEIKSLSHTRLTCCPFELKAGQSLVVQGVSGSGKTVLLRAVADLDVNQGEIYLCGQERATFNAPDWRRQVCYLAAESAWWASQTGQHFSSPEKASKWLERLGLSADCLSWPVRRLSSGEKQRLALIRALIQEPKVLLLDEPTAALDIDAISAMEAVLDDFTQQGGALLLVTHNPEQIERFGGSRLRVDKGIVEQVGTA